MPINKYLFANNVRSHLTAPLTAAATTFSVTAGDGAKFPAPDSTKDQTVALTIVDDAGNMEIVYVTERTDDTFTVTRAQEGTTAKEFAENSVVELRITAGSLNLMSSEKIYFGDCTTAADVADKEVSIPGYVPTEGSVIYVRFVNDNTVNEITLNINNTGAFPVKYRKTITPNGRWYGPNTVLIFIFIENTWQVVSIPDSFTVYQYVGDSISGEYPILTTDRSGLAANVISNVRFDSKITLSPSADRITAGIFKGNLEGKLTTPRYLDGVSFDGSDNVLRYGESTTAGNVAAKTVSIPGIPKPPLVGTIILVNPKNTNSAAMPLTLAVNNGPAYPIKFWGSNSNLWVTNKAILLCCYDLAWNIIQAVDNNNKISQYVTTADTAGSFPILTTVTAGLSDNQVNTSRFVSNITITPSTGTITAPTFSGALSGNATTATTATNAVQWNGANKYVSTAAPSGGVNGDIWFQYI